MTLREEKWLTLALVMLCCCSAAFAQQTPAGTRKELSVKDYNGKPDWNSGFLARTNPVLSFQYYNAVNCAEKGKIRFSAETKVSVGEKSWMKVGRIRNKEVLSELLSHEQGHYDLSLVFALDLANQFCKTCFDKLHYKEQADLYFKKMNRYYDSLQLRYDIDTDHMRNKQMQVQWKKKIKGMLVAVGYRYRKDE